MTAPPSATPSPATSGDTARGHKKPAGRAAVKVGNTTGRRVVKSEHSAQLARDRRASHAAETFGDATRFLVPTAAESTRTTAALASKTGRSASAEEPPAAANAAAPGLMVEVVASSGATASASICASSTGRIDTSQDIVVAVDPE